MKKIIVYLFVFILTFNFVGCVNISSTEQTEKTQYSPGPSEDPAPQEFASEEEFVKAVREKQIVPMFKPEKISFYYHPKVVPEGAVLQYVSVYYSYITLIYTFDTKEKKDLSQQIVYIWYRDFDDPKAYMDNEIEKRGYQTVQFEGAKDDATFLANTDYKAEKANKDETGNICWEFIFVQDGKCFAGTVPWTFEEKDIAKYFDMEKVMIE